MARVLVVDDEAAVLAFVTDVLRHAGHVAVAVEDGDAAVACVRAEPFDLAVVDVKLPRTNGIAVIGAMRALQPNLGVVAITGFPDYTVTVAETARAGEFEFLEKPFTTGDLLRAVSVVMHRPGAKPGIRLIETTPPVEGETFEGLVGASPPMRALYAWIRRVAPTHEPVLLQGETGTGKELVARAIHRLSAPTAFVPLNCAAAGPEGLLEKELFGSERGAYTDAREDLPARPVPPSERLRHHAAAVARAAGRRSPARPPSASRTCGGTGGCGARDHGACARTPRGARLAGERSRIAAGPEAGVPARRRSDDRYR
jgi:two-component system NtrC family response regulator